MAALQQMKVLVCFDCPVLQAGMLATLAREADFACIESEASSKLLGTGTGPDVVVADHQRGVAWAHARKAGLQRPPVLIVTHSDRESDIRAALSGGVQGYMLVDDVAQHLAAAVRAVRPDRRILSPQIASRLAQNLALDSLTRKEEAVLVLVVEGLCNKAVGRRLGITTGTVKSHLRSAYGKLGASSRTQAIAIANRRGLLQSPTPGPEHDDGAAPSAQQPPLRPHALPARVEQATWRG